MPNIRDLGINLIPEADERGALYAGPATFPPDDDDYGRKRPSKKKKPSKKPSKPAKKAPAKKPSKKPSKKGYRASGLGAFAVAQLKRQLEEELGREY